MAMIYRLICGHPLKDKTREVKHYKFTFQDNWYFSLNNQISKSKVLMSTSTTNYAKHLNSRF